MRKTLMAATAAVAVAGLGAVAVAADPVDRAPAASAYLTYKFGGVERIEGESFFYGLRIDSHRVGSETTRPALAQVEFNALGFLSASMNGLPFAQTLRMNQAGGAVVFTAVDWGLLALGVAGVGVVTAEVLDSDESDDPPGATTAGGGTGGGGTGGTGGGTGGTGGGTGGTGGGAGGTGGGTGGTGGGTGGLLGGYRGEFGIEASTESERLLELDGGTGFMGDLIERN